MFTQHGLVETSHFDADKFEAFALQAADDFANQAALDGVRFGND